MKRTARSFEPSFKGLKGDRSPRPKTEGTQRERVPALIFDEPRQMAYQVARRIAGLVEERQAVGQPLVLGLPTGSTPVGVYQELVRMHQQEGLDLSNVITFNLDEYYPMDPENLQSYHRFMQENFFDHVNIPEESIHIPRGDISQEKIEEHCLAYEHAIEKAGGIDLMLLGIGRSGHVGFNEPGSSKDTRTRLVVLDEITRKDAASDFFGEENVPYEAITMGVGTILDSREIILMATGEHKAPIVRRAVEEEPTREVTASYLQEHPNAAFYLDRAAASALTREQTPWVVGPVEWDDHMAKRAVIWLSSKLEKPIPRLESADFFSNHLHGLAHAQGGTRSKTTAAAAPREGIDGLCLRIFEDLRRRIAYREDLPKDERIIIFSPHPDDDVISMGGMLGKLVDNGNDITVAYMTNGSVAVFDADVRRYLRFLEMSAPVLGVDENGAGPSFGKRKDEVLNFLAHKDPGQIDTEEVQRLKSYIRYSEATAAIEVMGLRAEAARFLDMPFYRTGRVRKRPIGEEDVQVVLDLLEEIDPAHIFVAGDLSDPHGTHRMCYQAIKEALGLYRKARAHASEAQEEDAALPADGDASGNGATGPAASEVQATSLDQQRPLVWLYRGAWQEWEVDRTDVFVPMSKAELSRKIEAIFKHESQKDRAMFPGAYDDREFWQRAVDRNRGTAERLCQLGLPAFYAAEAFVTTFEMP